MIRGTRLLKRREGIKLRRRIITTTLRKRRHVISTKTGKRLMES
jgi:hypothetical protein